jgi:large subunit ribosomal protein L35
MLKTQKSVSKRVRVTKNGKILRNTMKQNHYLSKLTGRQKQAKRKQPSFATNDIKAIKRNLPYN